MWTVTRVGLGAAAMAAGRATQIFWELVDRGMASRHGDRGLAAAIDRTVTAGVPRALGQAIGSAINACLETAERARGSIEGAAAGFESHAAGAARRAGLPTRADLDEIRKRLDRIAESLDRLQS